MRLFAVCGRTRNFSRLLADRILNFLRLELLADKAQVNFFSPLACSCSARTYCVNSCACIIFGLYNSEEGKAEYERPSMTESMMQNSIGLLR